MEMSILQLIDSALLVIQQADPARSFKSNKFNDTTHLQGLLLQQRILRSNGCNENPSAKKFGLSAG